MPGFPDRAPEAILFDCDGTLLLTAELHFDAISAAAANQGQTMPRDWYMEQTGLGRNDLIARFVRDFHCALDPSRMARESIALTVDRAIDARENTPVAALARAQHGKRPMAVVTNSEREIAFAFLTATRLIGLFDALITIEDAPAPKPAPDLYLLAAGRLGVRAASCLVLEDSAQGVEAAIQAGATCLDVRLPDWQGLCHELFIPQEMAVHTP